MSGVEPAVDDDIDDDAEVADGRRKSNSDGIFRLSLSLADAYALVSGGSSWGCG